MANNYQSVSSGIGELKNFYQGPMQDQFSEDINIWRGTEKSIAKWDGYKYVRPLRVRRNQGIGATADGGILPAIGRQTSIQAEIFPKYNYLRFGLTAGMIAAAQSDKGSFVRAAAYELEMGYGDLKSDCNRQFTWTGNGNLARANAAVVASASVTLKGREDTEPALKFIDVGIALDIYTSAGALVQAGVTVQSITSGDPSSATATVVFDQPVTCSISDIFVRANSYGQEIQGLLTQLDGGTSTVFGIDRSLYQQSQGNVVFCTSTGATGESKLPLSLDYLQQAEDNAERRGGRIVNALYSDFASRKMYQKLLTADKRYPNTVKGDGGFSDVSKNYLEWNGKAWIADKDCPTRIFFLPSKNIERVELKSMEFAEETGSMYIADSETDRLEVRVRFFANIFNAMAAGSAVLTEYTSP